MSAWTLGFILLGGATALFGVVCMPAWIGAMRRSWQPPPMPRECFDTVEDYIKYLSECR